MEEQVLGRHPLTAEIKSGLLTEISFGGKRGEVDRSQSPLSRHSQTPGLHSQGKTAFLRHTAYYALGHESQAGTNLLQMLQKEEQFSKSSILKSH